MLRHRSTITCVEPSAEFVRVANAALQKAGVDAPRASVLHASIEANALRDASYDLVTFRYVLQHLRRPSHALAEAWRLLRPGGLLVVVETDDMLGGVMDPFPDALQRPSLLFSALQAAMSRV